jgi:hypothetical protein
VRHPVHGPLVGDEAGHAHLVASLTHRTTDRFKTSRSIRSRAFSARNRFSSATPRRKPLHAFVFSAVLSNPVTLGARVDAQVALSGRSAYPSHGRCGPHPPGTAGRTSFANLA